MAHPVIRQLDEAVVNKIAAGEVIQRPASALKELLENSLDAGSTQISVVVKEGGCKLLQITDNGHGIRKADLPILCHRHTTSKLKAFEDLETIDTLGFRGEALCSISFVSTLTVTTMTANALHGWRVAYKDSEMLAPGPKAVASVQGTTIAVEDLFYNVPTRRKALKSAAEEYARVVDIVSRYAVYKARVAFSCKRHGEARADVSTLSGASRLDNIRAVYGVAVAKELLPISVQVGDEPRADMPVSAPCCFRLEGYVSSASYSAKSSTCILFINDRCVECPQLKKAMEATYTTVLPKAGRPFMFLDLRLPPRHVEVNMHPTKREVGILNQEEVVEAIRTALERLLTVSNSTRTFTQQTLPLPTQTTLDTEPMQVDQGPNTNTPLRDVLNEPPVSLQRGTHTQGNAGSAGAGGATGTTQGGGGAAAQAYRPQKLVRVDGRAQTMEGFLSSQYANPRAAALAGSVGRKRTLGAVNRGAGSDPLEPLDLTQCDGGDVPGLSAGVSGGSGGARGTQGTPLNITSELDSIRTLASEVETHTHEGLTELLKNHVLVGMADDTLALLQHQTKLYLVNVNNLSHDFFYQQVLRHWERCRPLQLCPPPSLRELMSLALDTEEAAGRWKPVPGAGREEVCSLCEELLRDNRAMLHEYLALSIDEEGRLTSIPELLPGHTPDLGYLPDLVMSLGRDVDWEEEMTCFRGLAQVLASFYSLKAPLMPVPATYPGTEQPTQRTTRHTPLSTDTMQPPTRGQQEAGALAYTAQAAADTEQAAPGAASEQQLDTDTDMAAAPTIQTQPGQRQDSITGALGIQGIQDTGGHTTDMDIDTEAGGGGVDASGRVSGDAVTGDNAAGTSTEIGGGAGQGAGAGGGVGNVEQDASEPLPPEMTEDEVKAREWMIRQVLFPAFRMGLRPGRHRATDGSVVLLTSLEKLYRVFERC